MKKNPKNPKLSLQRKYKRRLVALARIVEEVDHFGVERLKQKGIHQREDTERLLVGLRAIKHLLPDPFEIDSKEAAMMDANLSALFDLPSVED